LRYRRGCIATGAKRGGPELCTRCRPIQAAHTLMLMCVCLAQLVGCNLPCPALSPAALSSAIRCRRGRAWRRCQASSSRAAGRSSGLG
jgi:hypothetical protein